MKYIESQFSNPHGLIGHLVGLVMAYENRSRNQWALSLLNIQPNDRILEIGFGPGWAIRQAGRLANQGLVVGVDRSPAMVRQAAIRNLAQVISGRVVLRHGTAAQIAFDNEVFNRVYTVNSFHEWGDPARGLQEVMRVLVPGGTFLIVEHPHGNSTEADIKLLGNRLHKQLQSTGFKSMQVFSCSIHRRVAIGLMAEKP